MVMHHASRDRSIDFPASGRAAASLAEEWCRRCFNCGIHTATAITDRTSHTPMDPFQPIPVQWPMAMLNPDASEADMFMATL